MTHSMEHSTEHSTEPSIEHSEDVTRSLALSISSCAMRACVAHARAHDGPGSGRRCGGRTRPPWPRSSTWRRQIQRPCIARARAHARAQDRNAHYIFLYSLFLSSRPVRLAGSVCVRVWARVRARAREDARAWGWIARVNAVCLRAHGPTFTFFFASASVPDESRWRAVYFFLNCN